MGDSHPAPPETQIGDALQSGASRLAEYVREQGVGALPYEVHMALLEVEQCVTDWTAVRTLAPVPSSSSVEQAEDEERAEIADAAYMKGHADALGDALSVEEIAKRREVWMPVERALVEQDRVAGSPEDNHDPHVTRAPQPEAVAKAVLRAAEPKLRALFSSSPENDEGGERS